MSADIPTCPPQRLVAGDSASWFFRDGDYPSADWTAQFAFECIGKLLTDTAWAVPQSDGSFLVTVPAIATASLPEGSYMVSVILSDGTSRKTNPRGPLPACRIDPDPAQTEPGDRKTWAQQQLGDLEKAISVLTQNSAISYYQIGRRIFQRTGLEIMMHERSRLRAEIAAKRRGGFGQAVKYRMRPTS